MLNEAKSMTKLSTKYSRVLLITGKISEAKGLQFSKTDGPDGDLYCTARIDNNSGTEFTTNIVANTENPFWAEDFNFETRVGFQQISFILCMHDRFKSNGIPLGIVFLYFKIGYNPAQTH
jgi:hypothetical protein